jgi:hypothetical protein
MLDSSIYYAVITVIVFEGYYRLYLMSSLFVGYWHLDSYMKTLIETTRFTIV